MPHPTTLVKLVGRAGPEVVDELNTALLDKLAQGKLLRARKLRVDTMVVEADIDYPTDVDQMTRRAATAGGYRHPDDTEGHAFGIKQDTEAVSEDQAGDDTHGHGYR